MNYLQKIIIILNFKPFTYFFKALYALGLTILIKALSRQEAVHSVFGSGSYFEGECLYGLSDIDLIIVIGGTYERSDPAVHRIPGTYNRVRRFFPFLGKWDEKAENVIFLYEIKAGFPLNESFRLRAKRRMLTLLCGEPFPAEFIEGPVSTSEVLSEINTLIRTAVTKGEFHSSNLRFWKKIFIKLADLSAIQGLDSLAEDLRNHEHLSFMKRNEIILFIKKSSPDRLFALLLDFAGRIFQELKAEENPVSIRCVPLNEDGLKEKPGAGLSRTSAESGVALEVENMDGVKTGLADSSVLGLLPKLNYFPMEGKMTVVDITKDVYEKMRRLIKLLYKNGKVPESYLVRSNGLLFIVSRQENFVDVVPLDPILFSNIHEKLNGGEGHFAMPAQVYREQNEAANKMFSALAGVYRKNEGHIKKMPFPCVYLEEDLTVIRDAFHRIRVYIANREEVDLQTPENVVKYLREKHPDCKRFLDDLLEYYLFLAGKKDKGPDANNIYRCLHQFMGMFLSGESNITVDDHRKRLGITVGIITRNRAADLREALESVTGQIRMPDEVLIVDNGSKDNTADVIQEFRDSLPINYYFLKEEGIPAARNLVIEKAGHDIVSFTDDDCIVEPEWLLSVERGFLRADNIGIVGGWVMHEPGKKRDIIDTYYSIYHHNKP